MDALEIPETLEIPVQLVQLQQDCRKHYPAARVVTAVRVVMAEQKAVGALRVMQVMAVRMVKVALPNPLSMVLGATAGQGVKMVAMAERDQHLRSLKVGVEQAHVTPDAPVMAPVQAVLRAGGLVVGALLDQPPAVTPQLHGLAVAVVVVVLLSPIPVAEVAAAAAGAEVAVLELLELLETPAAQVIPERRQIQPLLTVLA